MPATTEPDGASRLTDTEKAVINRLQHGLPLVERPYAAAARELGIAEAVLLECLRRLLDRGILTRFGPMFHAGELGGGLTLAAMSIPDAEFGRVAGLVNRYPEVAHNYRRDHTLNMWFVLATETEDAIPRIISRIEEETGYPVYNLPREEEFHVRLHFHV